MPSVESREVRILQRIVLVVLACWFAVLVTGVNFNLAKRQANDPGLPYGIFTLNGNIYAQDFAYNMLYLRGIRDRLVTNPYRLDDQEQLMRRELPGMNSGMSHAYSPVAFVLAQPLLNLSGRSCYLVYTILSAAGALLLYQICLLPRAQDPRQLLALMLSAISIWVVTTFAVGQTPMITTAFAGFFWYFLRRRLISTSLTTDLVIALFFWALCLKPSVAIVPAVVLAGCRAWRVLAIGAGLLLITWLAVSRFYGGWLTGLSDYLYLLNHYHNADFSPFMQRASETAEGKRLTALLFEVNRDLVLACSAALIVLSWTKRISRSELFQGMIWTFLLFSPYLMPSENIILCLLIVEGTFFQTGNRLMGYGKLLLVAGILDLRAGVTFFTDVDLELKWILFAWILAELVMARRNPSVAAESDPVPVGRWSIGRRHMVRSRDMPDGRFLWLRHRTIS